MADDTTPAEGGGGSLFERLKSKPGLLFVIAGGALGLVYLLSRNGDSSSGATVVDPYGSLAQGSDTGTSSNIQAPTIVAPIDTGTPDNGSTTKPPPAKWAKGSVLYTASGITNPMINNKKHAGFNLSRSTKVEVLKKSGNNFQVKILSGAHKGKTVYLTAAQLRGL